MEYFSQSLPKVQERKFTILTWIFKKSSQLQCLLMSLKNKKLHHCGLPVNAKDAVLHQQHFIKRSSDREIESCSCLVLSFFSLFCAGVQIVVRNLHFKIYLIVFISKSFAKKSVNICSWIYIKGKAIYTNYSKHWPYTVAHTIDCVCSKMLNHGLSHGLFL